MIDGLYRRRRPPALIRLLWLAVAVAIAYLSLYPLAGWRLRQPSMFAFLSQGFPRFYSNADIVFNIAAYVVFGLLLAVGWYTRRRPWLAVVLAGLAGTLLSLTLESLQSYLPTRVPSLLDFSANAAGAVLGGVLGALAGYSRGRSQDEASMATTQWFEQGPAAGWALLVLWLVAQLPTQRLLFSTGHLHTWLPDVLPALLERVPQALGGLALGPAQGPFHHLAAMLPEALRPVHETLVVATMLCIVGILVMDLLRPVVWRIGWIAGLMGLAVGLRVASSPRFESAQRLLVWLTSGAQGGILLGTVALCLLGACGRRKRLAAGTTLIVLGLLLVNLAPADPFFETTQAAAQVKLTPAMTPSLRSLVSILSALWPLLALAYFAGRLATPGRRR